MVFDQTYPPSNLWNINFDICLSWKVYEYAQPSNDVGLIIAHIFRYGVL